MRQALKDLGHAERSLEVGDYEFEVLAKGVFLAGRKEVLEEARRIAGLQPSCSG